MWPVRRGGVGQWEGRQAMGEVMAGEEGDMVSEERQTAEESGNEEEVEEKAEEEEADEADEERRRDGSRDTDESTSSASGSSEYEYEYEYEYEFEGEKGGGDGEESEGEGEGEGGALLDALGLCAEPSTKRARVGTARDHDVSGMRVVDIRAELGALGLGRTGKKEELVARLRQARADGVVPLQLGRIVGQSRP